MAIAGKSTKNNKNFYIRLPKLRQPRNDENIYCSSSDDIHLFISAASKLNQTCQLRDPVIVKEHDKSVLETIYSRHRYPLRQGPILPFDYLMEYEENADKELNKMTKFIHSDYQKCAEWSPSSQIENFTSWDDIGVIIPSHPYCGIAGEGSYNVTEYKKFIESDFEIANIKFFINEETSMNIDGAASTKSQKKKSMY